MVIFIFQMAHALLIWLQKALTISVFIINLTVHLNNGSAVSIVDGKEKEVSWHTALEQWPRLSRHSGFREKHFLRSLCEHSSPYFTSFHLGDLPEFSHRCPSLLNHFPSGLKLPKGRTPIFSFQPFTPLTILNMHSIPAEQRNSLLLVITFWFFSLLPPRSLKGSSPGVRRQQNPAGSALYKPYILITKLLAFHQPLLWQGQWQEVYCLSRHSIFWQLKLFESSSLSRVKICHCCEKGTNKDRVLFTSLENALWADIQSVPLQF